jgi:hypothetical protein
VHDHKLSGLEQIMYDAQFIYFHIFMMLKNNWFIESMPLQV